MNIIEAKEEVTLTKINQLITECNGKLDLTGGTLTGDLTFINDNTNKITLSTSGDINLDGDLSVGGDINLDGDLSVSGDINVDCDLSVDGDTTLGKLVRFYGGSVISSTNDAYKNIGITSETTVTSISESVPFILIRSTSATNDPGSISFLAHNGSTKSRVDLKADGTFTLDNNQIVPLEYPQAFSRKLPNIQTAYAVLEVISPNDKTNAIISVSEPLNDNSKSNGVVTKFGGQGATIIGSGESPSSCMGELVADTSENMYITSDSNIHFYTNANTYDSKKIFSFTTDGKIVTPNGSIWIA